MTEHTALPMICPNCGSGRREDGFSRNGWFWLGCHRRYNPSIDTYSPENVYCQNIQLETANAELLAACKEAHRFFLVLNEITQPEGMPEMVRIIGQAIRNVEESER